MEVLKGTGLFFKNILGDNAILRTIVLFLLFM